MLGMGLPVTEDLLPILESNLTLPEVDVLLLLPVAVMPLQPVRVGEIKQDLNISREELLATLKNLAEKGFLYYGKTENGESGYALQQVGFGFPQTFFWRNEDSVQARNMVELVGKYFNRRVTADAYGGSETKASRYIPVNNSIDRDIQAVMPYHTMENILDNAAVFAVAHCACRVALRLRGRGCNHPLEVCLKFDDMAEYLIRKQYGREITRKEALGIISKSEDNGLVHFVDNARKDIKHNCNCCGCACWNVGNIKRRKIPRDILMATYFIRVTDENECTGCGNCVDICPVNAITVENGLAVIDEKWCIGCGLCVRKCDNSAASLQLRTDKENQSPLPDFIKLHSRILDEKGLTKQD